jgi:hypothetical protein
MQGQAESLLLTREGRSAGSAHDRPMAEGTNSSKTATIQRPIERKGIVTEVVVPIAASGVGGAAAGAASAIVSNAIEKPKKDK